MFLQTILMKIETIEQTRSPLGKLRLRFSDRSHILVYPTVIGELSLYPGKELTEDEVAKLLDTAAQASARERALRIIAASSVTERELQHRLVSRGEAPAHAREAVDRLKELRLLDDGETARQIVRSGIAKGYGEGRLKQLLYEKRVPKELWQQALQELPDPMEQIQVFLHKRFRTAPTDPRERKRAADALLRRGFGWNDIRRAMERYGSSEEFGEYEE